MEFKQSPSKSKRGGKRPGAGRPKGQPSAKEIVLARAAAAIIDRSPEGERIDPAEAMLEVTRWAYRQWREAVDDAQRIEWGALMMDWGNKVTPYYRPRLASVEAKVNVNISVFERIERGRQRLSLVA